MDTCSLIKTKSYNELNKADLVLYSTYIFFRFTKSINFKKLVWKSMVFITNIFTSTFIKCKSNSEENVNDKGIWRAHKRNSAVEIRFHYFVVHQMFY